MSLPATYVHRCFLSDIEATLEQQWSSAATATGAATTRSPLSPHHRSFQPVFLRLLGTVVLLASSTSSVPAGQEDHRKTAPTYTYDATDHENSVNSINNNSSTNSSTNNSTNTHVIVLDDGTGVLAHIHAPSSMTTQIQVQPGMTLECIARATAVVTVADDNDNSNDNDNKTVILPQERAHYLVAHQLAVVQDPHAETLRWLELSYRRAVSTATPNDHRPGIESLEQRGYPCPSGDTLLSTEELYNIIWSESETENDNHADRNTTTTTTKARGVSLLDLSDGLEIPMPRLEAMIEDLQLAGQIYRNEVGNYLPL